MTDTAQLKAADLPEKRRRLRSLAEAVRLNGTGLRTPAVDAFIAACTPQTILELLDELEAWTERANQYHRKRNAAEQRVAALEEGLEHLLDRYTMRPAQYRAKYGIPAGTRMEDDVSEEDEEREQVLDKARALLTAAPSGVAGVAAGKEERDG